MADLLRLAAALAICTQESSYQKQGDCNMGIFEKFKKEKGSKKTKTAHFEKRKCGE